MQVDFVITKSISRFSRNTIDCLEIVRKLIDLGIFIYFEKEDINTGSMDSELMLTILSSLAESESHSISENSKWSIQRRFRNGTYKVSSTPYGYDYVDGKIKANDHQAKIIKRIFADTLSGISSHIIARELNDECVPTKRGGNWTATTILGILRNEKYTGDLLMQKTYTDENFMRYRNNGEVNQYFIENNKEQQQILINLMTKAYLEPALFNKQSNELRLEAIGLKEKKESLYRTINGGMTKTEDLGELIKYVSKIKSFESFDEGIFKQFVESIIVVSPTQIGFSLKCGITLKEGMER